MAIERKHAYVDNVVTIKSKFNANEMVTFGTIKNSEITRLISELNAVLKSGKNAKLELKYSEKTGKYGTFVGGSISAKEAAEYKRAAGSDSEGTDDSGLPF